MTKPVLAICLLFIIAACASVPDIDPAVRSGPSTGKCDAVRVQDHIGHIATAQSGAKLMQLAGARSLRWGPPGAAWTMDYRDDRLNVRYDDAMKIVEITCG